MKKSLTKSEIIENLHRVLAVQTCEPRMFSIVQVAEYWVHYHLLVKCSLSKESWLQIVTVSLHFGWIEYQIDDVFEVDEPSKARLRYIKSLSTLLSEQTE